MFRYLSEGAFFLSLARTPRLWRLNSIRTEDIRLFDDGHCQDCPISAVLGGEMHEIIETATSYGFDQKFAEAVADAADGFKPGTTRRALLVACSLPHPLTEDIT